MWQRLDYCHRVLNCANTGSTERHACCAAEMVKHRRAGELQLLVQNNVSRVHIGLARPVHTTRGLVESSTSIFLCGCTMWDGWQVGGISSASSALATSRRQTSGLQMTRHVSISPGMLLHS